MNISDTELMHLAEAAMEKAYAPYSGFFVGAAVTAKNSSGQSAVFTGCNIENASFSPTLCAERVAAAEAVKNGFCRIQKVAVCGGKNGVITDFCPPCGVCRQFLIEFGDDKTEIILTDGAKLAAHLLCELLPYSFNEKNVDPNN